MMNYVCSLASFSLSQPEVRDSRQVLVRRSGPLPRGSKKVPVTAPTGSFQIRPRAPPNWESSPPVLNLRRLSPARRRWDHILPSLRTVGVFCLCPEKLRHLSKNPRHIRESVFKSLFVLLKDTPLMLSSELSPHHPSTITDFLYPQACALRTRAVGQVFKGAVTLKVPMKTNLTIFNFFMEHCSIYYKSFSHNRFFFIHVPCNL